MNDEDVFEKWIYTRIKIYPAYENPESATTVRLRHVRTGFTVIGTVKNGSSLIALKKRLEKRLKQRLKEEGYG